jgi:hypothetical protein
MKHLHQRTVSFSLSELIKVSVTSTQAENIRAHRTSSSHSEFRHASNNFEGVLSKHFPKKGVELSNYGRLTVADHYRSAYNLSVS